MIFGIWLIKRMAKLRGGLWPLLDRERLKKMLIRYDIQKARTLRSLINHHATANVKDITTHDVIRVPNEISKKANAIKTTLKTITSQTDVNPRGTRKLIIICMGLLMEQGYWYFRIPRNGFIAWRLMIQLYNIDLQVPSR